ncbi:hypothetical protein AR158_c666R [Paramecium bursaria Chlorella virus AR158]|uniref:hypothetical protein n=1 Tax=Paramecium bursaria Chlorella virus AR158 TaxID=380598 RepID=UPI00015AA82D|nr:hypothetical protein AR158_c666R [Paramecium bursaria Chlorella virus AR158]ABU44211.1 hypothetical protein AR158_c666R [Paramecium bursaria Chlorella virus AR158]
MFTSKHVILYIICHLSFSFLHTSASESSFTTHGVLEFENDRDIWSHDLFKNELCDTITFFDDVIEFRSIIKNHFYLAHKIRIDNTGEYIDTVLIRETRSRCDPAICTIRNTNRKSCRNCNTS